MGHYRDVVVIPVPKRNIETYRNGVEGFFGLCREHGALSCMELQGDDVPVGKVTSFPRSLQLMDDEIPFVAIMTYRDRAHRDEVTGRVMKDPRIAKLTPADMGFDGSRLFFGGFTPFYETSTNPTPRIQPYLFFRGRCEEAINFYRDKLGAEVLMLMRFKDNPDKPSPDKVPAALDERIMHAAIRLCGSDIMLSDGMRTGPLDFNCMSLSISAPTEVEADRIFDALADGGTITMPIGKMFFSPRFGAVTDKFGVAWMVIVHPPGQA